MSVRGVTRYHRLLRNIVNWQEYVFYKRARSKRALKFTTRPHPIHFEVSARLYQVFKELFMEDFYEIERLSSRLPHNPLVIDVGANAGFFEALLFSKIKEARVFAYEPLPANFLHFKKMIGQNSALKKVQLFHKAITGISKEKIELFTEDTEDNTVVSSVFAGFNSRNQRKLWVPACSLTSVINYNKLDQIDLLKLDCEGSEYDILYNTDLTLLNKIKMMVIEVHQIDNDRHNVISLNNYLQAGGYDTRYFPVQESSYYLEALKK